MPSLKQGWQLSWLGWFILLALFVTACQTTQRPLPQAQRGLLDVNTIPLDNSQILPLTGEWRFQERGLVPPGRPVPDAFVRVPGSWRPSTGFSLISPLDSGQFTYELTIRLPANPPSMALQLPPIHSAYRLFVNGQTVVESGRVGTAQTEIPNSAGRTVLLPPLRDSLHLRLWVSNAHFVEGGIRAPIYLGSSQAILRQNTNEMLLNAGMVGGLLLIGCYHLSLFRLRRREPGALYFGLLSLLAAWRVLFVGDPIFFRFWPDAHYELTLKSLFWVFPLSVVLFTEYVRSLFPKVFANSVRRGTLLVGGMYCLLVLFTNAAVYSRWLTLLAILTIVPFVHCLWVLILATRRRSLVAPVVLMGLLILFACLLHDLSVQTSGIRSTYLLPVGMLVFTLCQSLVLAIRFTGAYNRNERLTVDLQQALNDYQTADLQRREAEQRRAIEELKTQFFTNITHEFRTPLSLIIAPVERLLRESLPQSVERSMRLIDRNARQLLNLINQLLDLSKIDANQMALQETPGDLAGYLTDRLESFRWLANEKVIMVEYEASDNLPPLYFDLDKWDKILTNLLSNAFKFTPSGGTVRLNLTGEPTSDDQWRVTLTVTDNGPGIAPAMQAHIFERFYQVDSSATRAYAGTGIGLALVRELTRLMNGQITVESEAGQGATFRLTVPLRAVAGEVVPVLPTPLTAVPAGVMPRSELPEPSASDDRPTVLLVEDNSDLRSFLEEGLRDSYRVFTAPDGEAGWERCLELLPDVVISDVMMPRLDGLSLCQRIRESPATNHVAVLLLTARASVDRRIEGLSTGANDYLGKPFHFEELRLRVTNLIQYQQTLRAYYNRQLTRTELVPVASLAAVTDHPFVQKLLDIIAMHLDSDKLTVEFLADAMAMSARTLNRKLSSVAGLTPVELIRNSRLQEAARLLRDGLPVFEVAYRVGFDSPSYFGQCFKEYFALTPSEYARG